MASRPTEEFRAEAVRVALTSGLPGKRVASDFGIGCDLPPAKSLTVM
jgi:transposase